MAVEVEWRRVWQIISGVCVMKVSRFKIGALRQWLSPGMRVKRWLVLQVAGATMIALGLILLVRLGQSWGVIPPGVLDLFSLSIVPAALSPIVLIALGTSIIGFAMIRMVKTLVRPFRQPGDSITASLYDYTRRSRGPHIVAIGGGTGLPALLRGLKGHTSNITAVVTVADDGGSSGRLREELGMLPPGDFRNNIAALSRDEALMTQVLQYRFGAGAGSAATNGMTKSLYPDRELGGDLQGHAFGNLLLAALAGVTGSFDEALLAAERVLAMEGRVLPSTLEWVTLVADVQSRTEGAVVRRVTGESAITKAGGRIQRIYLEPSTARAYPPAVRAILQADVVVVGPGSLFTSIMPNLLVRDVANALRHTRAKVVYICNLATQPGETDAYSVADHVDAIISVTGPGSLDYVVANSRLVLPPDAAGETILVQPAWPPRQDATVQLIEADLVDEARPWRHDSVKLAGVVRRILDGDHRSRP